MPEPDGPTKAMVCPSVAENETPPSASSLRPLVAEAHVVETQLGDRPDLDRLRRAPLDRLVHQRLEVQQRGLGFAVRQDDVAQLLQRLEDRHRDELHRNQFARREHVAEDQPQERKQDRQLQQTQGRTLQEREQPDAFDLLHLEREDGVGLAAQAPDLGKGQPQAFNEFDIAQRLGDEAGIAVGLARDRALLGLDLALEQPGEPAQHHHPHEKHRHQQPVLGHRIPGQEDHADQRRESGIDEGIDQAFAVGAHLLQQGEHLAAAQILELLELQSQQMAQAVVEDRHAQLLHDQARHVFLQRLRQAREHGHQHRDPEQAQHARHERRIRVLRAVDQVDDGAEDDRVDQGQHLGDAGEDQGQQAQAPVGFEVGPEDAHAGILATPAGTPHTDENPHKKTAAPHSHAVTAVYRSTRESSPALSISLRGWPSCARALSGNACADGSTSA